MDIKKELQELNLKGNSADRIVDEINRQHKELIRQQQELIKKQYLIQVIDIANKMEKAVEELKFLVIENLEWLEVETIEGQYGYRVVSWLIDEDGECITKKVPEQANFVKLLFDKIGNFNEEFANINLSCGQYKIALKPGIGENILNLFLSDELRKVLEYNKMHLELPDNNNSNIQRPKM